MDIFEVVLSAGVDSQNYITVNAFKSSSLTDSNSLPVLEVAIASPLPGGFFTHRVNYRVFHYELITFQDGALSNVNRGSLLFTNVIETDDVYFL